MWISNVVGSEKIMKNGLKARIIKQNIYTGDIKVEFEDGTKKSSDITSFQNRSIPHATLRSRGKGTFGNFDTESSMNDDLEAWYKCTCRLCGEKFVGTPQMMMSHKCIGSTEREADYDKRHAF